MSLHLFTEEEIGIRLNEKINNLQNKHYSI